MKRTPPNDEISSDKRARDQIRESRQYKAISSILANPARPWVCLLIKAHEGEMLEADQWGFLLKGLIRCAMASDGKTEWNDWRRLFGTQKKHWIKEKDKTYRYLPSDADSNLPTGWRGRVNFWPYDSPEDAGTKLAACPMSDWKGERKCALIEQLPDAENGKLALMQVHDVEIQSGRMFSALLEEVLSDENLPFAFLGKHSCTDCLEREPKENTPGAESLILMDWEVLPQGAMISGVSQYFVKAFRKVGNSKSSFSLLLADPEHPENLAPAIVLSSLKGVFRSAMGWLFEKIRIGLGHSRPCISDYWREGDWPVQWLCPLRLIFGGPIPGTGGKDVPELSQRGVLRFSSYSETNRSGSYVVRRVGREDWQKNSKTGDRRYPFPQSITSTGAYTDGLNIESAKGAPFALRIEIEPGPHSRAALISLCLAMDLVGAGFFRLGRFSTRGFGAARFRPDRIRDCNLADLIDAGLPGLSGHPSKYTISGKKLLENSLGISDPVGELTFWLKGVLLKNGRIGKG